MVNDGVESGISRAWITDTKTLVLHDRRQPVWSFQGNLTKMKVKRRGQEGEVIGSSQPKGDVLCHTLYNSSLWHCKTISNIFYTRRSVSDLRPKTNKQTKWRRNCRSFKHSWYQMMKEPIGWVSPSKTSSLKMSRNQKDFGFRNLIFSRT